jgi:bacteriorhodopsin
MQKPFPYSPFQSIDQNSISRKSSSIGALVAVIMLLVIGFVLVNIQQGASTSNSFSSFGEFSSGMPLP